MRAPERLFSAEDFRRRAALETGPRDGDDYGDHRLNPSLSHLIVREGLRDAAVLIPVVDHSDGATMLLTKRTEKLRSHSGQIAFPGGRIDPEDASAEDAALREAEEEIGLGTEFVEIVGRMPDYVTGSGFRIAPVLSVVRPGFLLTINEDEVDDAFEVPLAFLMDPANHNRESRLWQGRERYFYTMPFGERYIWGVTAGIVRTLYERLYA
ncbi:MAG: CoA pyrophosphatase [Rhizobiaceae bacterium]|nr:CoA pyrophosphatase [Rhizobiaceae bacterium]MCV0407798.1 CoA pyrophosphatase [Rhizobiaceae bacterium]